MERLTCEANKNLLVISANVKIWREIYKKLNAYEDTGLEPEEVAEVYRRFSEARAIAAELGQKYADRADMLLQEEAEGRLLVLPCKVGGELWVNDRDGKPREMVLDAPDIRCHCAKEDNLCMALCDNPNAGICAYRLKNDGTDFGKTVFLTREEAEAALKDCDGA